MNARENKSEPVTYETVREIALSLPGAEEGTSYGTPACKVERKLDPVAFLKEIDLISMGV